MVKVYYGTRDPFEDICPTPLLERGDGPVDYNDRWGLQTSLTFDGQITGDFCLDSFSGMYERGQELIRRLSKNFQSLSIVEGAPDDDTVYPVVGEEQYDNPYLQLDMGSDISNFSIGDKVLVTDLEHTSNDLFEIKDIFTTFIAVDNPILPSEPNVFDSDAKVLKLEADSTVAFSEPVTIRRISFPETKWANLLPFQINIDLFDEDRIPDNYGVLEPRDEFSFSEAEDGLVTITHETSAKGLNTSTRASDAFDNARGYVSTLTGWQSQILPHFLPAPTDAILTTIEERGDRMNAEYGVTETYVYDPKGLSTSNSVIRYTVDYRRDDEHAYVTVDGNVKGGRGVSLEQARASFSTLDLHDIASGVYASVDGDATLYSRVISSSISEDANARNIDFSAEYTDDPTVLDDIAVRDNLSFNEDCDSQSLCASLNVRFEANSPKCHSSTWQNVKAAFDNFDARDFVATRWAQYGYSGVMKETPESEAYSQDEASKTIEYNVTYCRRDVSLHRCFDAFDYDLSFTPAITGFIQKPVLDCNAKYIIQNTNSLTRARYGLRGQAHISACCSMEEGEAAVRGRMDQLSSQYFVGSRKHLSSQQITTGSAGGREVDFSAEWTAETDGFFLTFWE